MDGFITEIDNTLYQNMKSLSFLKYRKKIFEKMRNRKEQKIAFKKIFSASCVKPKINEKRRKIMFKSKSTVKGIILPYNNKMSTTSSLLNNKLKFKKTIQSFYHKGIREDASTSLSSLIKTNTSFFNSTNFNFNSCKKKLILSSTTDSNFNDKKPIDYDQTLSYSFTLSFDKYVNDFLRENKIYQKDNSFIKFFESIRLMRRAKLINYTINKNIQDLKDLQIEEINNYNQLEFSIKNSKKFFFIYFNCLKHYLQELANIKRREQDRLDELKQERDNIRKIIAKKNMSIKYIKEKIVNMKELKKFLIEVKYGKTIDKIPNDIKKAYGYLEEEKKKEKENNKDTKKSFSKLLPKNIMASDLFKKSLLSLYSKKKGIKKSVALPKNIPRLNEAVFDSPEQFMSCFQFKSDKIKENLDLYWKKKTINNKYKFDYENILKENQRYMLVYLPEEEKLLKIVSYQRKRNIILNEKLNDLLLMNKCEQNSLKNIATKLYQIILNIDTQMELKKFITEKNLDLFLSSQTDYFINVYETLKMAKYVLKLIEMIIEVLINKKREFKNNPKLKEYYRKVHVDIERANNYNRYKLQVSIAAKKEEEKNKKVLGRIVKMRINSVLSNRKRCFEEQIPDRILLKAKIKNKKNKNFTNKYEEAKDLFSYA